MERKQYKPGQIIDLLPYDKVEEVPFIKTPGFNDSVGKLLWTLGRMARVPITYGKDHWNPPQTVSLGPSLFRTFHCTPGCVACCLIPFSLDFLPSEYMGHEKDARALLEPRSIEVNGLTHEIYTRNRQKLDKTSRCVFLGRIRDGEYGGCTLMKTHQAPLECQRAPQLQVLCYKGKDTVLLGKPYGRAWSFTQLPHCQYEAKFEKDSIVTLLRRYQRWADYLHIATYIPDILAVMTGITEIPKSTVKVI